MTEARVFDAMCHCAVNQPNPNGYSTGSIWKCEDCFQNWECRLKASGTRVGAAIPIGGVYLGGMRSNAPVHVWRRIGTNVARKSAEAAARLSAEAEYVADVAAVRALIARNPEWSGLTVRDYRARYKGFTITGPDGQAMPFADWTETYGARWQAMCDTYNATRRGRAVGWMKRNTVWLNGRATGPTFKALYRGAP